MAKIIDTKQIKLDYLEVGLGQVRKTAVSKDINELADSIKRLGQLEPIVVCTGSKPGKYEIITGQRRFLACREIGLDTIWAAIIDEKVDSVTAKIMSLSENLIRTDLSKIDLVDVCTELFKKYGGSWELVHQATGLPIPRIKEFVYYEQLNPELQELVNKGLNLKTAIKVQKAANTCGDMNTDEIVALAKEMGQMSNVQQERVVEVVEDNPDMPPEEVIEMAKHGEKVIQITTILTANVHKGLQAFANEESVNLSDAAGLLIKEGLRREGFFED